MGWRKRTAGLLALACIGAGPTAAQAQLGAIIDGLLRPSPPPYYRPPPPPPDYPGAYAPGYAAAPPVYRPTPRRQTARSGGTVAEAQRMLTELGYVAGPVDGSAGPRLTEAVRAFQGDHGQTIDGRLGTETLAALRAVWRERQRSGNKPRSPDGSTEIAPGTGGQTPADNIDDIPPKLR